MTSHDNSQKRESQEKELPKASIRLEFFRHDEKDRKEGEKYHPVQGGVSLKGRENAQKIGAEKKPVPEVGIIYGSPRKRSTESGYHQLFARKDEVVPDMTMQDIERLLEDSLGFRKGQRKHMETDLLDFYWEGEFKDEANKWYEAKKLMEFMLHKSDDLAREKKDTASTTYSRSAANVARLVDRFVRAYPTVKSIIRRDSERDVEKRQYEKFGNELQRFLSSHGSVIESFLLKVIEKTKGREAAEKSVGTLIANKGFSPSEGFSLRIEEGDDDMAIIIITCKDREWNIDVRVLSDIIRDADALDREIKES